MLIKWTAPCPLSPPIVTPCVSLADGLAAFRAFLKTEFSEENLEFWLACEDFKKTRSAAKLASKAQRIFEEFIDVQAPREVGTPAPRAGRASLGRRLQVHLLKVGPAGRWGVREALPSLQEEVMVRSGCGGRECHPALLELPLLVVTHPLVRATTLTRLN